MPVNAIVIAESPPTVLNVNNTALLAQERYLVLVISTQGEL